MAGRGRLRDGGASEPLVPIIVMAIDAAEIELTLPLHEQFTAPGDERLELRVVARCDCAAARWLRDKGSQRQQVAALIGKRWRLLVVGAAQIDTLFQIN